MKLTINLATRRYLNLRLLNAWLAAGFLLLGLALLFRVRELAYNQAELGKLRALGHAASGRAGGPPAVTEEQLKALGPHIRFANTLIERKAVNWLALLDHLEEVVPDGVSLSSLAPSEKEQLLKVGGIARSFPNLAAFLENLERSKNFSEVYLLSQSETKVGQTQHGIVFTISCKAAYR